MAPPPDHPSVTEPRIGVLLVNLGTPEAPDVPALKRYLGEFLSDPRVVEIPQLIWQPLLRGVILNTRPKQSAKAYAKVWMDEGSPLMVYTKRQAEALGKRMGSKVLVDFAMRYGNPNIPDRLRHLKLSGCDKILIAPLYPQYSGATTATVVDKVGETLERMRHQPTVRYLAPYYDHDAHIEAVADSVREGLTGIDFTPDAVITSFHGMPLQTLYDGDPYHCQCRKTARLVSEKLRDVISEPLIVSFQSRFGRAKWLDPATEDTLEQIPQKGIKKVAVVAPGFAVDCVETLEEIAIEGEEQFREAGGERFAYIPCLNDSERSITMLEKLVRQELAGWLD
ncbi:ferrochelatase [Alterisphingorhabdus coralli]|uniref:Ferrochelatase n=1 Tax=Alterisphingorhabdus coralli TaxID=3071408 RepID=A0AA97F9F4_9SPHN|nr:ferrochelatase [Parasphingorhabdus sp. SCSIO 66989]WOE76586.1 ferrochelatase [Parasphingorhabdus sp. SCSIO 66989]